MKKICSILLCTGLVLAFMGCKKEAEIPAETEEFKITPVTGVTKSEDGKIYYFAPETEDTEYTISGKFTGQLVNKTKGTVFILSNAELTAMDEKPVIVGETNTELKAAKETVNKIIGSKKAPAEEGKDNSAVYSDKCNITLGGSGTCTIEGGYKHGIKADNVKMKGTGKWTVKSVSKESGSAIRCDKFECEKKDKDITATLELIDSKFGIHADHCVVINDGNYVVKNNEKGFVTAAKNYGESDEKTPRIQISGGTFKFEGNTFDLSSVNIILPANFPEVKKETKTAE